ncbi:MAG: putative dehydrogenase [Cognaticolwellia sp.]|jgi:predicted dehydrogenase
MGQLHARRVHENPDLELLAVVDPAGVPAGFPGASALPRVDAVIIATPADTHRELAEPLLQSGVACLIEKPLATRLQDLEALSPFQRLSVNHLERFNPAVRALPQGLRPRYFAAERLGSFQRRGSDVNVALDLMVHDLDLLGWLTGHQEPSLMRATGLPVMTSGVDMLEAWIEIGDCVAKLSASRVSPKPQRSLRLVSASAYYSLDLRQGRGHTTSTHDLERKELKLDAGDAIHHMHKAFFAAVRGEGDFPVPAHQAAFAARWALTVSEAARARL